MKFVNLVMKDIFLPQELMNVEIYILMGVQKYSQILMKYVILVWIHLLKLVMYVF